MVWKREKKGSSRPPRKSAGLRQDSRSSSALSIVSPQRSSSIAVAGEGFSEEFTEGFSEGFNEEGALVEAEDARPPVLSGESAVPFSGESNKSKPPCASCC